MHKVGKKDKQYNQNYRSFIDQLRYKGNVLAEPLQVARKRHLGVTKKSLNNTALAQHAVVACMLSYVKLHEVRNGSGLLAV